MYVLPWKTLQGKYGATLGSVPCEDVTLQITDNELVIDDQTSKALACLNPAKRKLVILGIRVCIHSESYKECATSNRYNIRCR